jgi:hypothetical protein
MTPPRTVFRLFSDSDSTLSKTFTETVCVLDPEVDEYARPSPQFSKRIIEVRMK